MPTIHSENQFRISPRRVLVAGDLFRVSRGPVSITGRHRVSVRGLFQFLSAMKMGRRWYVEAVEVAQGRDSRDEICLQRGARHTLFVGPGSYKRLGVHWKPYQLRKVAVPKGTRA